MASGVNKVIIIGNLGADPEVRSFPDGGTVASISVATSESWMDKATGQKQERTEWHRISLRDRGNYRLGQIAAQYLRKGAKVYIEGKLQTRKWIDSQGVERYTTEVVASEMQMLDRREPGTSSEQPTYSNNQQQQGQYQQAPQANYQQPQGQYQPAPQGQQQGAPQNAYMREKSPELQNYERQQEERKQAHSPHPAPMNNGQEMYDQNMAPFGDDIPF